MTDDLKFFSVEVKGEEFPLSLGGSRNTAEALEKLNALLVKREWPAVKASSKENPVILIEGHINPKKHPLTIIGEGSNRVAEIGS